ncbi:rifin [Plasmodium falciparum IGH-CR14]|uniref:Rifin n=1 Tax=Plasmodium falciparum IGH-CR14 TaxID=580059 RepID=A0A0L1I675_PLAFA|nr:rifin [Plasmodium falciparum IGH-CR14]
MKIHYINILLFELPLNILIYNQRNHYITRTPKATTRTLCECELYAPSNYDNDPQMKAVMENYNRQTSDRFKEYDERMKTTRQKCKDKCDKEIQKIILKDKLEKELAEKFVTLQTDIQNDAIPTCVCEKSLEDKTEKLCLKCGYGLGSNIPLVGLINGVTFHASVLKYAVDIGTSEGVKAAISKGMEMATQLLKQRIPGLEDLLKSNLAGIVTETTYNSPMKLGRAVHAAVHKVCEDIVYHRPATCSTITKPQYLYPKAAGIAGEASKFGKAAGTVAAEDAKLKAWNAAFTWEKFLCSPLGISIIVTVCIVVMLIIIYLILRYRRKKKMKKKLQYIKLLKE